MSIFEKIKQHITLKNIAYTAGALILIVLLFNIRFSDKKSESSNDITDIESLLDLNSVLPDSLLNTPPEHDIEHLLVSTPVWDILATLQYREEMLNGEYWGVPDFSPEIQKLDGTIIELKGYMIPIEEGKSKHNHFLISVLPLSQCYFCGRDGIPEMVEVYSNKELPYTDKIITVKGKLKLNYNDENHFAFMLMDAQKI